MSAERAGVIQRIRSPPRSARGQHVRAASRARDRLTSASPPVQLLRVQPSGILGAGREVSFGGRHFGWWRDKRSEFTDERHVDSQEEKKYGYGYRDERYHRADHYVRHLDLSFLIVEFATWLGSSGQ
jgi:hypothetical protein